MSGLIFNQLVEYLYQFADEAARAGLEEKTIGEQPFANA
jgi:hypothetical protein